MVSLALLFLVALQSCSLASSRMLPTTRALPLCRGASQFAFSHGLPSTSSPLLCQPRGVIALSGSNTDRGSLAAPLTVTLPEDLTNLYTNVAREAWQVTVFEVSPTSTMCEVRTVPSTLYSGSPPKITAVNGRVLSPQLELFSFAAPYNWFRTEGNTTLSLTVTGLEDTSWQATSLVCFSVPLPPTSAPSPAPTLQPTTPPTCRAALKMKATG